MTHLLANLDGHLLWIPLLPLLGAALNGILGSRLPRGLVTAIGVGSAALSFLLALAAFLALAGGEGRLVQSAGTWIASGSLRIDLTLALDRLSGVMVLVITGVGSLIHLYSVGYMAGDRSYARYFSYLNLFLFAMLVLVMGDSLPLLFVGWEGVGLCSYLLIGFWFEEGAKAAAGMKAFLVNRIGDFGFLVGMFLLFSATSTLTFPGLQQAASSLSPGVATAACLALFLGACGKSAQIPLYIWLPDAMAGPTPVSALIHAATMVTAGVYLVARLSFLFLLSPAAMTTVATVGAATALFAATIGLAQNDIKKVLAYSTISQLGYMFLAVGVGAFSAGIFHLMTHAFFKACLFLGSGSVIHSMEHALHGAGEERDPQDMRNMGGLARHQPWTHATFLLATLAIAGAPLFSGFFSKDEILWRAFSLKNPYLSWYGDLLWLAGFLAAGLTALYMFRLYFMTFRGSFRAGAQVERGLHESPATMTIPLVVLGLLSLVGGWVGIPALLGGGGRFEHWLHPVLGRSEAAIPQRAFHLDPHLLEWLFMGASVAIAACGLLVAWRLYGGGRGQAAQALARRFGRLHQALVRKWYVDEIYDFLVVRPLLALGRVLWRGLDAGFIDEGLVNGSARSVGLAGLAARQLQTGNVQVYLITFALGVAGILLYWFQG